MSSIDAELLKTENRRLLKLGLSTRNVYQELGKMAHTYESTGEVTFPTPLKDPIRTLLRTEQCLTDISERILCAFADDQISSDTLDTLDGKLDDTQSFFDRFVPITNQVYLTVLQSIKRYAAEQGISPRSYIQPIDEDQLLSNRRRVLQDAFPSREAARTMDEAYAELNGKIGALHSALIEANLLCGSDSPARFPDEQHPESVDDVVKHALRVYDSIMDKKFPRQPEPSAQKFDIHAILNHKISLVDIALMISGGVLLYYVMDKFQ